MTMNDWLVLAFSDIPAGTTGFDPEAWCPECALYKVRRVPKKRSPDEYRY